MRSDAPKVRRLYTPDEARRILGISPETLRNNAKAGLYPIVRLPSGHRRYDADFVDAIAQTRNEATGELWDQ